MPHSRQTEGERTLRGGAAGGGSRRQQRRTKLGTKPMGTADTVGTDGDTIMIEITVAENMGDILTGRFAQVLRNQKNDWAMRRVAGNLTIRFLVEQRLNPSILLDLLLGRGQMEISDTMVGMGDGLRTMATNFIYTDHEKGGEVPGFLMYGTSEELLSRWTTMTNQEKVRFLASSKGLAKCQAIELRCR